MADLHELRARFAPLLDQIRDGALARERERRLPHEEIKALQATGFTALRVPETHGGAGASLAQLFELLVELAAADPHIVQALRGHLAFVEDRLHARPGEDRDRWLQRFAAGELVGNAVTEIGGVALGDTATRLTGEPGAWTITGRKYYTTGSIFADWIDATALTPDGEEVAALVAVDPGRVTISDDWTGFGQRLTGSGTTLFEAAPVEAVYPFSERFDYQTSFYQLLLDAVLAGIARAAVRDAVQAVATRARSFSHGNTAQVREDPQVLELLGRLDAEAYAAAAVVVRAAQALDDVASETGPAARAALRREAELASARAQLVTGAIAVRVATDFFDGLGASATDTAQLLDRHWRNARTVRSHNPPPFKARIIGDALVNDAEPPYEWYVGVPPTRTTTASRKDPA